MIDESIVGLAKLVIEKLDKVADQVGSLTQQLTVSNSMHEETKKDIARIEEGVTRAHQNQEKSRDKDHDHEIRLTKIESSTDRSDMFFATVVKWAIPAFLAAAMVGGAVKYFS